ncbi:MAG: hypothetical protein ACRC9L_02485 [Brevinema sp.]
MISAIVGVPHVSFVPVQPISPIKPRSQQTIDPVPAILNQQPAAVNNSMVDYEMLASSNYATISESANAHIIFPHAQEIQSLASQTIANQAYDSNNDTSLKGMILNLNS